MDQSKVIPGPGVARGLRRMLRLPAIEERTGLARSSIYRAMEVDGFPRPVRVGRRAVAWVESEVEEWLDRKLAARGCAP